MSGFVEKIFDTLADRNKHESSSNDYNNDQYNNQYQQQQYPPQQSNYGGPPQHSYNQQQPQVPYPWVARWEDRDQRWFYVNEQTGERSWEMPGQGFGGPQGGYGGEQQRYGGGEQYPQQQEEKSKGHGSAAAWGIGGAAVGLGAGALLMHEGEEMSEFLCNGLRARLYAHGFLL